MEERNASLVAEHFGQGDHLPSEKVEEPAGILVVKVLEATGVPPMDYSGTSDPYVLLKMGKKTLSTPVIKKTLNPKWDHQFRVLMYANELDETIKLELWDWDRISSDDFIAEMSLPISEYTRQKPPGVYYSCDIEYKPVLKKRKRVLRKIAGSKDPCVLKLHIQYQPKETLQELFWTGIVEYFDIDGSNEIESPELGPLLQGLNPRESANVPSDEIFDSIDIDGDGKITGSELARFMASDNPLAHQIMPMTNDLMWRVFLSLRDDQTNIGGLVMSDFQVDSVAHLESGDSATIKANTITVQVRNTGKIETELIPNYIRVSMRLMYSNKVGRKTTGKGKVKALLKKMSVRQGKIYSSPKSRKNIGPFIEFHGLNVDEIRDDMQSFSNFNEFFYRKLKPDARPLAYPGNDSIIVSPADCRLNVFHTIEQATQIWIKGESFSLQSLLQDEMMAGLFEGGSMLIARLAPQDYHRYHSPVRGKLDAFKPIDGTYYTVNPIAVNGDVDVFCGNKRLVIPIQTQEFGQVCFIAVGATMVGTINMTVEPGQTVERGQELGYFSFGGSTCLVLFRRGMVQFDEDLLTNSATPIETLVQVCTRVGKRKTA